MEYVKKYGISRFFDTRDLPFFLIRYEKGETIIHPTEHTRYLQFVVEGTVAIYSIRRDGSQFPIASSDDFMMLGDVEFVNQSLPALFAEAKSDTAAVALSLDENKPVLDRDLAFLHYTLRSLVKKIELSTMNEAEFISLEDKLLHYIQYCCHDGLLVHIGKASENLHWQPPSAAAGSQKADRTGNPGKNFEGGLPAAAHTIISAFCPVSFKVPEKCPYTPLQDGRPP